MRINYYQMASHLAWLMKNQKVKQTYNMHFSPSKVMYDYKISPNGFSLQQIPILGCPSSITALEYTRCQNHRTKKNTMTGTIVQIIHMQTDA